MHSILRRHLIVQGRQRHLRMAKERYQRRLRIVVTQREQRNQEIRELIKEAEEHTGKAVCPMCFSVITKNPHICYEEFE